MVVPQIPETTKKRKSKKIPRWIEPSEQRSTTGHVFEIIIHSMFKKREQKSN